MTIIAAGVLPKADYNGSEYYYFGVTKQGELSTFCGRKNKGEKNRHCAVREFMEESLGAIAKKDKIAKILKKNKNVERVKNADAKQVIYITKLTIKNNPLIKFQIKRNQPGLRHDQKEMQKIVAIKTSNLIQTLRTNQQMYKGNSFRGDAWGTLQKALSNNLL